MGGGISAEPNRLPAGAVHPTDPGAGGAPYFGGISSVDSTWMTTRQAAAAIGWGRYHAPEVARLIAKGEIRAEKDGRQWKVDPADVARLAAIHHGFVDLEDASHQLRRLQSDNADLRARLTAAKSGRRMEAVEALAVLSLEECLEILGRYDTAHMTPKKWQAVYEARRRVTEQLDRRDHQEALGERPRGVPERATSRRLTTGIGPVDIWVWETPKGSNAMHGGPRPGARYGPSVDRRYVLRMAGLQARSTYGKPRRLQSARLRFLILERDHFTCRYCGRKAPDVALAVDHVRSLADGGADTEDNLVTACVECNSGKSGRSVDLG